jgi:hypothetical protein
MKRTRLALVLTLAQAPRPAAPDVEARALRVVGPLAGGRLCAGAPNTIRAELVAHGALPARPVALRLVLVLAGGDRAGALVAEGSVTFPPAGGTSTFTFINVDVPARVRGRGAALEVRANLEGRVAESTLANNIASLALDPATDWDCRPTPL